MTEIPDYLSTSVRCRIHGNVLFLGGRLFHQFIQADAKIPKEVSLLRQIDRHVARLLEDRREFEVIDVIQALAGLSQADLLLSEAKVAELVIGEKVSLQLSLAQ